ncbi:AraC family transcriptional regulator [Pseudodesulfovibrio sp. zrk46]|uniref:AraC family transcriptional regulator n=1 Tax=Pseudodesulfovibrio sp. zrk46 TaxID=2725288 RepID=UPI001449D2E2|nr:AraC family transcriptional regulator [Pseudodesulfovibrio sp. zrk46]QJB56529.1 helix-turn-helix domain-containing protein [Pseudodesulfovibrio sp. zrk46]
MTTATTLRLLHGMLPSQGASPLTHIPFLGMVSSTTAHRLHSVSLPQSALVFVLSGKKQVIRETDRIEVSAGEILLYPARMEALIENTPDGKTGSYVALCLTFDETVLARALAHAPSLDVTPGLNDLKTMGSPLITTGLDHLLTMVQSAPDNERLISLCREEMLLLVAQQTDCLPLLWNAASTWGSRCSGLIGMEPGKGWTADLLAAKLGTSERTLRRQLQKEGTNLRHILQEVRLNAGLAMLQTGGTSVGETAYLCGYNSASRFAGLFRERFGVNPSEVLQYNAVLGQQLAES